MLRKMILSIYRLIFFFWVLTPLMLTAQRQVKGLVVDRQDTSQVIDHATILYIKSGTIWETKTNAQGQYTIELPESGQYALSIIKNPSYDYADNIEVGADMFLMHRIQASEGYVLALQVASEASDSISHYGVEIYDNTHQRELLTIPEWPNSNPQFRLEDGAHYTILIRKAGFKPKLLELHLGVNGCIVCMEGVQNTNPDNDSKDQQLITAKAELQPCAGPCQDALSRRYANRSLHDVKFEAFLLQFMDTLTTYQHKKPISNNSAAEDQVTGLTPDTISVDSISQNIVLNSTLPEKDTAGTTRIIPIGEKENGYFIAIKFSRYPLPPEDDFFKSESLIIDYSTADRNHLYLIGKYDSREAAEKALTKYRETQYPDAYVVGFSAGIRIY